jgi:hypothetical protein
MIEGAVIAAVCVVVGMVTSRLLPERRSRRRLPGTKSSPPACGCGHHYSFHDPSTGECHGQNQINVYGKPELHACGCRQYSGPVPLPEYYAPELPQ